MYGLHGNQQLCTISTALNRVSTIAQTGKYLKRPRSYRKEKRRQERNGSVTCYHATRSVN